jgi:hypothetical protein
MATVAVNGTLYAIFSTTGTVGTATTSADKIYACRTATLKFDAAVEDASSKESGGWFDGMPGQKKCDLTFGGVWDEAGAASALTATEIIAHIIAGNVARKFAFVPAALGTTIPGWMGMGIFNSISVTGDNEKPSEFSGGVTGTGPWALFTA